MNYLDQIGLMTDNQAIAWHETTEKTIFFCDNYDISVNHAKFDALQNIMEDLAEDFIKEINRELTLFMS